MPSSSTTASKPARKQQHLKYTSPRCELEDDELFLPQQPLRDPDERWRHMMQQAGPHSQDASVLDFTARAQMTPATLKLGVPPQVASRVRELHIALHNAPLPEWLDVVCGLFFSLQRLYTCPEKGLATEQARMRRLYILYRLPDLQSIDGKNVTVVERQLARPSSPNGYKVNRCDWVVSDTEEEEASSTISEDDSSILQNHGDAVEVSLYGVVKRVNADPPRELWDEPELPKPFQAAKPDESSTSRATASAPSHTASMERAHRSMSKSTSADIKTPTSTCGGLAAAFADGNPCVAVGRRTIDEPHTVDYPSSLKQRQQRSTDKYSIPSNVLRGDGNNRNESRDSHSKGASRKKQVEKTAERGSNSASQPRQIYTTSERTSSLQQQRPTTPEPMASPSSASLSSPFPIQFRSKSFNGALPSRTPLTTQPRPTLPRKMSSPDLSPQANNSKGTINDTLQPTATTPRGPLSPKSSLLRLRAAERPPPCPPGSARRMAPKEAKPPKRRGWRSKQAIRSTSIVDNDEEEEEDECLSDDEDVIEHS